uniref:Uncharacterized protein n=1 Tax=Caenorhabditis brenneri TaxID=135651 RepID=B6VBB3_CAEBE|nr:hypothetical protein Cbre_JD02.005 [Caenorhabditis brenneri]
MSERSKYSLNGVYRCENFAQHVENDDFPRFPIGSAYIKFRIEDYESWVYPFIFHHSHPNIQIRVCSNILKNDGSSAFEREFGHTYLESNEGCCGEYMALEKLLDEKNGYLDDGALTVEYGFQVESEQGEDGIWRFNFHDKFFEWQTKDYMFEFTFRRARTVFSHKQIIKLHSPTLDGNKDSMRVPTFFDSNTFFMCAQITHGVRLQMDDKDYRNVARVAFHFGFFNTVRYCERQLIVMEVTSNTEHVGMALKCNMRCYLVHLLKQIETKKQLINILSILDLENMSSESMKAIVAKIFSL